MLDPEDTAPVSFSSEQLVQLDGHMDCFTTGIEGLFRISGLEAALFNVQSIERDILTCIRLDAGCLDVAMISD